MRTLDIGWRRLYYSCDGGVASSAGSVQLAALDIEAVSDGTLAGSMACGLYSFLRSSSYEAL
jgi:hypothetical protein